jgi:hypothetical protein
MSTRNRLVPGSWTRILGLTLLAVGALVCRPAYAAAGPPPEGRSSLTTDGATPPYSARALAARAETELRSGQPGRAVLDLERARLLAPRAAALAAALTRARAAAGLPAPQPSMVRRLEGRLGSNEWAWIGILGLSGLGGGAVALAWGARRRAHVAVLLVSGAVVSVVGLVAAAQTSPSSGQAIVVAGDVVARIGPFAQADPAFSAPAGAEVDIERTFGDYALVAGPEGRGWVPRREVETILPSTTAVGQRL